MSTIRLTVYGKPNCMQCNLTYRRLDEAGIEYDSVDLSQDDNALEYIKDLDPNYKQAPIVVVDEHDHWSGYDPDNIDRIAAHMI